MMKSLIRCKVTIFMAAALFIVLAQTGVAGPALDVGDRRQVFIDGRFIEQSKGIELTVHRPQKTGSIIIEPDRPWEDDLGQYHCVLKDGETYHLWYTVYVRANPDAELLRSIAYARSSDGIKWEKPDIGLVEIYGKRNNNIVLGQGFGGIKGATHGCMVFIDPKAGADEKFRLVSNPSELGKALQIFSSGDGIHWKLTHSNIMKFTSEKHHLDSQNVIFWDERIKRYVAYVRRNVRPFGTQGRSVARAESKDLSSFPDVEELEVVFTFADGDPIFHRPSQGDLQVADFYTNGTIKYPWAQDAYYMFPSLYFHYGSFLTDFRKGQPVNAGSLDSRFAACRNGKQWRRYDRHPFVRLGMRGAWDSRSIYMAYGIVPAQNDTEMYMYYVGSNAPHGWDRDDKNREPNKKKLRRVGQAPEVERHGIARLVIRRDGFISARADYAGGEFTTPPLTFEGDKLLLNIDTSAAGWARVEIRDADNTPIPGFLLDDCDEIYTSNEINRTVTWNKDSSLSKVAGKAIRLRFVMRDTDLYAFQFVKPAPGEASE